MVTKNSTVSLSAFVFLWSSDTAHIFEIVLETIHQQVSGETPGPYGPISNLC